MNIYLKAFLPYIIWSFYGPILNKASFDAFQSIFLMGGVACLLITLIYLFKTGQLILKKIKFNTQTIMFLIVSGIGSVMWLKSLTLIPVAQALLLFSSVPIMAILIETIFFKEKINKMHLTAIVLGVIGITMLVFNGLFSQSENFLLFGSFIVLFAAFLTAIQGFLIKELNRQKYPLEIIIFLLAFAVALVSSPFAFRIPWNFDITSLSVIVLFSFFGSIFATYFYIDAMNFFKVSTIRLIGYIEPLLGSLWGVVFLSQSLLPITIIGGFFILLASYLAVKSAE